VCSVAANEQAAASKDSTDHAQNSGGGDLKVVDKTQADDSRLHDSNFITAMAEILDEFSLGVQRRLVELGADSMTLAAMSKHELLEAICQIDIWQVRFADMGRQYVLQAVMNGASAGFEDLASQGVALEVGVQLPTDVVEAQVERLTEGFASRVVEVFGDDVSRAISEGLRADENVYGIAARIAETYGAKRDMAAERIARTELNRGLNAGAQSAWRQAGVRQNEWLASADSCEFCMALAGRRVEVGEPFVRRNEIIAGIDGGQYSTDYGDVLHPPLHPHCTCAIVAVIPQGTGD
jgi:hypothetical protein